MKPPASVVRPVSEAGRRFSLSTSSTVRSEPDACHSGLQSRNSRRVAATAGWAAVDRIVPLLALFRKLGHPVLYPHVAPKLEYDAGRLGQKVPEIMNIPSRVYNFVEEVAPMKGDILVPKKHPSAFFGTPLVSYLIDKQVDTLIVTGCSTSGWRARNGR